MAGDSELLEKIMKKISTQTNAESMAWNESREGRVWNNVEIEMDNKLKS